MDLLLLALLLSLAVWGFRKVRDSVKASTARKARASMPGYSPDFPITLSSARMFGDALEAARCTCGGRLLPLGETSRFGLRVAVNQCIHCGSDVDLYFVLPHLLN